MSDAIRFEGVVKTYGAKRALDGLDLAVPRGSIFGLIGSNGAGKTTFMSVTAGLVRFNEGRVDVLGGGPFDPVRQRGRLAILPQDAHPPAYARVGALLEYYAQLQGLGGAAARKAAGDVLQWVNLADRRQSPTRSLSHGMLRRFTIAQAFLGDPEIVILDEPMSGLDPVQVDSLRKLIAGRRGAQTIILSSHILSDLELLCDHVAFIENGRLLRQGPIAEITRRGSHLGYHLDRAPDVAALAAGLAGVELIWNPAVSVLDATYGEPGWTAATLNAALLPRLLAAGVGVLEVSRGSNLEREYLRNATLGPPAASRP
ncbi:MAG: ABC transporter ATP-binding protein [Kiritimatiellia bacterium]